MRSISCFLQFRTAELGLLDRFPWLPQGCRFQIRKRQRSRSRIVQPERLLPKVIDASDQMSLKRVWDCCPVLSSAPVPFGRQTVDTRSAQRCVVERTKPETFVRVQQRKVFFECRVVVFPTQCNTRNPPEELCRLSISRCCV